MRAWLGNRWARLVFATCLWAAVSTPVSALDIPQLHGRVNDYASLLSSSDAQQLESRLEAFETKTGHQFALLTVTSLQGTPIEDFSIKAGEAWRLGDKKRDDGLILVIAKDDHKSRIEVGYGLEGDIPDAVASRVLREVLQPAFRNEEYARGIQDTFSALIAAAGGDGQAAPQQARRATRSSGRINPLAIFVIVLVFIALSTFGGGGGRGGRRRRFFGPMGGFYGGFGGGGFGGGGFGGGGFGGGGGFSGGGGGFGGGGASGDW